MRQRKYLDLVRASRAIIPLLIVFSHASKMTLENFDYNFLGIPDLPRSGGVDFFFVLSGFMIYYIHMKDIGNKEAVKPFFIKRFIRIYPLYWILTLSVLPIYFLVPSFGNEYIRHFGVIIKSLMLIPQPHSPIISVAWSLINTVLFYFAFALTIYFGRISILPLLTILTSGILITQLLHLIPIGFPLCLTL